MKKTTRLLAALLAVVMLVPSLLVPGYADASFTDVKAGSWYEEAVNYVTEKGFMNGVGDGKFAPNESVTRAMFVTVLYRMEGEPTVTGTNAFADVPDGKWFTNAIVWAADLGITKGTSATTFEPNAKITRQDMCTMLARYLNAKQVELPKGEEKAFIDADKISGYAKDAVALCSSAGLILGNEDGSFQPAATATRAQLAIILMRLDKALHPAEEPVVDPTEPDTTEPDVTEPAPTEPDVTEPDPTEPDANTVTFSAAAGDLNVNVAAPETALPANASMVVSVINSKQQLDEIAEKANGKVLAAVDISFHDITGEIEPDDSVEVTLTKAGLDASTVRVVHIKDDGTLEGVNNVTAEPNSVKFRASDFSVYAIIGDQPTDPRLTVEFYNGETKITTVYVKESDTRENLNSIVYDPGVGTLGENQIFKGWTQTAAYTLDTDALNIDQVRDELAATEFTDGDVVKYYAVIHKYFNIAYYADSLCYGSVAVLLAKNEAQTTYTVNMAYTAGSEQNFEGWLAADGRSNIVSAKLPGEDGETLTGDDITSATVFPNGTILTIKGSVDFNVSAPAGHWLVFHENPNGNYKGATYIAPQFLKSGQTTKDPQAGDAGIDMRCAGYTFDGWYLGTTDDDGKFTGYGNQFTFGSTLSETTHLYAKWTPVENCYYTVIIWTENLDGDGWDYVSSEQITDQTPGADIDYEVDGDRFTGFEFDHTDIGEGENAKKVAADSSTVVNVYYARKEYTLTFKISNNLEFKTISGYELAHNTSNYEYYIKLGGQWHQITGEGYYIWNATSISSAAIGNNSVTYTYGGRTYRDGDVAQAVTAIDEGIIKTITAKYQKFIGDQFPIVGTNGVDYTGYVWEPQNSSIYTTGDVPSLEIMDAENTVFVAKRYGTGRTIHFYYYLEAGEGETPDVNYNGKQYVEHQHVQISSDGGITSTKSEDFYPINGFTTAESNPAYGSNGRVDLNNSNNYTMRFYYTRNSYKITYLDGAYFGGKDGTSPMNEVPKASEFAHSDDILFNADISSYGDEDSDDYVTPTAIHDGYVFGGWYVDKSCSTEYEFDKMPIGGVTVYAKWIQVRYRVFLKPNATITTEEQGTINDTSLNWGSNDQEMNFGVAYGDKISTPTGTRTGYEFIGWFRDKECTDVFNGGYVVLTDSTVPATPTYNKEVDMTDRMDKFGEIIDADTAYNSDAGRFWVTRKLVLYGKWRKSLEGASGINVVYELNGGTGDGIVDTNSYPDNTPASVQSAPTPANPENTQFLHWVLQKWVDEETDPDTGEVVPGHFEDTSNIYYPGESFTVKADFARKARKLNDETHEPENDSQGKPLYVYTITLRAEYGPKTVPTPSHIYWYANNNTNGVQRDEDLQINKGYDIPTPNGWRNDNEAATSNELKYGVKKFLGWARVNNTGSEVFNQTGLTASNLFLRWIDEGEGSGHYEAKNESGVWTEVTQVACDENTPYQDLYAVWSNSFYVYHSSTGELEAVDMPAGENATVDLAGMVEAGCYYGGWFNKCYVFPDGEVDDTVKALADINKADGKTAEASKLLYNDGTNRFSDGTALYNSKFDIDEDGVLHVKDNVTLIWSKDDHKNEDPNAILGTSIVPELGKVYYLKEISDKFFAQKAFFVYDIYSYKIQELYLIGATDDRQSYKNIELFQTEYKAPAEPADVPEGDFYLFGWIGGKNYACENDYQNMGKYKFINGKLTTMLPGDNDGFAYVAVKTASNASWYMTDGYPGDGVTSATLYSTSTLGNRSQKLQVPADTLVTFTLTPGEEEDTYVLSYEVAGTPVSITAASSVTFVQKVEGEDNSWVEEGDYKPVTKTSSELFKVGGYVVVANIKEGVDNGSNFSFYLQWTTLDGVIQQGPVISVTIGATINDAATTRPNSVGEATRSFLNREADCSRSSLVRKEVLGELIEDYVIELAPGYSASGLN